MNAYFYDMVEKFFTMREHRASARKMISNNDSLWQRMNAIIDPYIYTDGVRRAWFLVTRGSN